ncbi:hypothetical protein AVEN_239785-1 [Araneus ventricosus]|uniref:Uncharacterized protein n=1 Tax=Araneus ventricosus TaxID=182803 RepID=A0A4Y2ET73_ARAVE|nr:hypothetical protein AVEN_239785-1 [Araneus ventricosus]
MYQYTIYTKGRYNNFAEGVEYSEAGPGRTVSELVASIWFSGVNRVFDSTRTGCGEPNPVGFSVSTKELAVHVGTRSYVVSRPSRTCKAESANHSKALPKPPVLVIHT